MSDRNLCPSRLVAVVAAWVGALSVLCTADRARADHTDLEEELPVELADAYPVEYLGREIQGRVHYEFTDVDDAHHLELEPRFEFGFPRNGQISAHVPLVTTFFDGDREIDLGRPSLEFMYNVNQETLVLPGFALTVGAEGPGTEEGGVDPFARLNISKLIPGSALWQGIHLNGLLQRNLASEAGERDWGYVLVAGYALRLGPTTIFVVDGLREQPIDGGPSHNLGELGLRVQTSPLVSIGVAGGAGASDDGDLLARGTFSVQWFAF